MDQLARPDDSVLALKAFKAHRMKWLATLLLLAMLSLLAWSAANRNLHPWLGWVHAFAEAAAVGAIADWFAVTALFRHPLGLPIPHTAIIPNNKDDIGVALGQFVEHNFLTPDNVIRKLAQRNLARGSADWLVAPEHGEWVARRVCAQIPLLLEKLEDTDIQRLLGRTIRDQLERLDLARAAGEMLDMMTADGRHQALLDQGLRALDVWLKDNRALIQAKVSETSKYTPGVLDNYITNRFVDGILSLLHEVAENPDHEVRSRFDRAVHELIHKLKTSPEYQERSESIKRDLMAHLQKEQYYRRLWDELKRRVLADLAGDRSALRAHVAAALSALADAVRVDAVLQRKLNGWALEALESLMVRHRHQVSLLISEVVKSWDACEIADRVEAEIGKDLQFIRINGTVVGGIVGLLLYGATQLAA